MPLAVLITTLLSVAFGAASALVLIRGTQGVPFDIQSYSGQSDAEKEFRRQRRHWSFAGLGLLAATFVSGTAAAVFSYSAPTSVLQWLARVRILGAVSDWLALASAILGVVGTIILFVYSYALPPPPFPAGPLPGDPQEQQKILAPIKARDRKMRRRQRTGLGFLFLSFALQAAVAIWPK